MNYGIKISLKLNLDKEKIIVRNQTATAAEWNQVEREDERVKKGDTWILTSFMSLGSSQSLTLAAVRGVLALMLLQLLLLVDRWQLSTAAFLYFTFVWKQTWRNSDRHIWISFS